MDNLSTAEIDKFNAHASSWWSPTGPVATLHAINPLRLNFITNRATLYAKKVLDVGCGGGILAEGMAKQGAQVVAIDCAEKLLKVAKLHNVSQQLPINYQLTTIEQLTEQQPDKFALITCMEMLEHVPSPLSIIENCAKLLQPNGDIFFSTINRNMRAYLSAIVGAEYVLNLLPKGTHDYAHFIKPSELCAWARKCGLVVKGIQGIDYNPISKQFKLSNNITVNYIIHFQSGD